MNEEIISNMRKLIIDVFVEQNCLPIQNLYLHSKFDTLNELEKEALEKALLGLSTEGILEVFIQKTSIPLKVLHVSLTKKGEEYVTQAKYY